jgi:short-chain fatty acids transporter
LINNFLKRITGLAINHSVGVLLVTIVSILACYINWGFGLVVSALIAVEVSKKLKRVNFGLMIASAYSGFLVWHGGLSGSIPLKLTNPTKGIKDIIGSNLISVDETMFSSFNLIILFSTIFALLLINYYLSRSKDNINNFEVIEEKPLIISNDNSFSGKLENSKLLLGIINFLGVIYIFQHFYYGGSLNMNIMIFVFLILSMIFNLTARSFLFSFNNSVKDSSGILLQFPFYAGIMGMMASSGLAASMSEFFVSISTENTFFLYTYISAGIVNFFVPSGGGQWAIQGPIILPVAKELGVSLSKASMAIAWGDAWTNIIQPFWALPLLSIGKIKLKDMMGYCVIIFILVGLLTSGLLLVLS